MILFLHGPSLFINHGNFCLSERKQGMVRKTKLQSKILVQLRNVVLDILHQPLFTSPLCPAMNLRELQWGSFASWLLFGQDQQEALVEGGRVGEKQGLFYFFFFSPSSFLIEIQFITGCVPFQGHSSCRPFTQMQFSPLLTPSKFIQVGGKALLYVQT